MSATGSVVPETSQLFLGGRQRNLAAWGVVTAALIWGVAAFWIAWPMRESFPNKDSLGVLRAAVACLALAQMMSLIAILFFLRDILLTLRRSRPDLS